MVREEPKTRIRIYGKTNPGRSKRPPAIKGRDRARELENTEKSGQRENHRIEEEVLELRSEERENSGEYPSRKKRCKILPGRNWSITISL